MRPGRTHVSLFKMAKLCPGKRHAWIMSNVGLIRKQVRRVQLTANQVTAKSAEIAKASI